MKGFQNALGLLWVEVHRSDGLAIVVPMYVTIRERREVRPVSPGGTSGFYLEKLLGNHAKGGTL